MEKESKRSLKFWFPYLGSIFWILSLSLWFVLWFINPYSNDKASNIITIPGVFMAVFCLFGIVISIKRKPILLALISILSFFPVGLYLLLTPGIFKIISLLISLSI